MPLNLAMPIKPQRLFNSIPSELSKKASRYQVSSVDARSRSARVADIVADMLDSMTVYGAYHADDPGVGLALNKNPDKYKLFLADTGLFVTLAFRDKDITENTIYEKLLSGKLPANLGYVYENAVAQMLRAAGNELYYHTMPSATSNHNYEIRVRFRLSPAVQRHKGQAERSSNLLCGRTGVAVHLELRRYKHGRVYHRIRVQKRYFRERGTADRI